MPTASFNPVFFPPLVGIPPPKTLTPSQAKHLYGHIRTVAFYLDAITAMVPQTRDSPIQIGLEPIIAAAIPVFGPFIGAFAGIYIILLSLLFGISWSDVGRMVVSGLMGSSVTDTILAQLFNLLLDTFAGLIPFIGSLVDFAFKANLANLGILEDHLRKTPKYAYLSMPAPKSWWSAFAGKGTANW